MPKIAGLCLVKFFVRIKSFGWWLEWASQGKARYQIQEKTDHPLEYLCLCLGSWQNNLRHRGHRDKIVLLSRDSCASSQERPMTVVICFDCCLSASALFKGEQPQASSSASLVGQSIIKEIGLLQLELPTFLWSLEQIPLLIFHPQERIWFSECSLSLQPCVLTHMSKFWPLVLVLWCLGRNHAWFSSPQLEASQRTPF